VVADVSLMHVPPQPASPRVSAAVATGVLAPAAALCLMRAPPLQPSSPSPATVVLDPPMLRNRGGCGRRGTRLEERLTLDHPVGFGVGPRPRPLT
jgi:hypothetical protein